MGRLINSTYVSIDGVIENPQDWPELGSFSHAGARIQSDLLTACEGVVMGRRTYEGFAPVWTAREGDPFSDRMNAMPKYVASTTLHDPTWTNTHVLADDAVGRIANLKETGGDLVQYGFGSFTRDLMGAGLLDELRLWLHPFFVGRAATDDLLFRPSEPARFELEESIALDSGIVVLRYLARH